MCRFEKDLGNSCSNNTAGASIRALNFGNKNHDLEKGLETVGSGSVAWRVLRTGWNRTTVGGK